MPHEGGIFQKMLRFTCNNIAREAYPQAEGEVSAITPGFPKKTPPSHAYTLPEMSKYLPVDAHRMPALRNSERERHMGALL